MPRFIPLNYQQNSMVVINYLDQLQAGTFEYAISQHKEHKEDIYGRSAMVKAIYV